MKDCLFCKIAAGEIPSVKVYEDEECVAFLDIGPLVPGHTLVIPKAHFRAITEAPAEVAARLLGVAQRVAKAQKSALGAVGVNVVTNDGAAAGQTVPHLHFHVIPQYEEQRHVWNWTPHPYATAEEAAELARKLGGALGNGI